MRWVTPGNVYFDQSLQASLVPVPYEEGLSWLPFSLSVLTSGFLQSWCSFLLCGIAIPDSPKWRVSVSNYCSTASISKAFVWRRSSKQTLKYFTTDLRTMLFFLLGEQTDADNTACQGSPGRLAVEPRLSPQDREGQLQPGRTPLRGVREPGAVAGMGFVPVGVPWPGRALKPSHDDHKWGEMHLRNYRYKTVIAVSLPTGLGLTLQNPVPDLVFSNMNPWLRFSEVPGNSLCSF